jgi:hypothetical protein
MAVRLTGTRRASRLRLHGIPLASRARNLAIRTPSQAIRRTGRGRIVTYSNSSQSQLGVTIKKDATPPTITSAAPSRGPDSRGWYNHPVGINFVGSDATSGLAGCSSASYGGPDTASASFSGTCIDNAGNVSAPASVGPIQYDATPPSVSASLSRGPDAGGWYNHPVDFSASGSDNLSASRRCSSGQSATVAQARAAPTTPATPGGGGELRRGCTFNRQHHIRSSARLQRLVQPSGPGDSTAVTVARHRCVHRRHVSRPDTDSTTISGTCTDKAATEPAARHRVQVRRHPAYDQQRRIRLG